jgi:hypothetical protein
MHFTRSLQISAAVAGLFLAMFATSDARVRRGSDAAPGRDGYSQRGVQLYAGFGGQNYEVDDNDYAGLDQLDDGGSFFLGVGIGLDPKLSLYFEGNASEHPTELGEVVFGTGMVGVKYTPNTGHRHTWQPYGKVALGGMFLFEDESPYRIHNHHHDDNGFVGPAASVALGIDHFIGRRTAIFGELGLAAGQLDTRVIDDYEYELRDDIDVTSSRIQFGLRFRL